MILGSSNRSKVGWWILLAAALFVVALDQVSKRLVVANLALYESWVPCPALAGWIDVHYVGNSGAAFGLFPNGSLVFVIVSVVVSLIILLYSHRLADGQLLLRLSLGLQLGGALGNLIDRLWLGYVVDFLDLHILPVFNLADVAIVCGVALLVLLMVLEDRRRTRLVSSAGGDSRAQEEVPQG